VRRADSSVGTSLACTLSIIRRSVTDGSVAGASGSRTSGGRLLNCSLLALYADRHKAQFGVEEGQAVGYIYTAPQ
jgi:hypothetical protein